VADIKELNDYVEKLEMKILRMWIDSDNCGDTELYVLRDQMDRILDLIRERNKRCPQCYGIMDKRDEGYSECLLVYQCRECDLTQEIK
jgi:hypothetical protein